MAKQEFPGGPPKRRNGLAGKAEGPRISRAPGGPQSGNSHSWETRGVGHPKPQNAVLSQGPKDLQDADRGKVPSIRPQCNPIEHDF